MARKLKNMRLSPLAWWLLHQISKRTGLSEADVVEEMLRERGREEGLSFRPPGNYLADKGLALDEEEDDKYGVDVATVGHAT